MRERESVCVKLKRARAGKEERRISPHTFILSYTGKSMAHGGSFSLSLSLSLSRSRLPRACRGAWKLVLALARALSHVLCVFSKLARALSHVLCVFSKP